MDLHAIRTDLASVLVPLGWNAYGWAPEDLTQLPAAIAGVPSEIDFNYSMALARVVLTLTLVVSLASAQDAQARLDEALSSGVTGSIQDALKAATGKAWRSLNVTGAGNVHPVQVGAATALSADVNLEILG